MYSRASPPGQLGMLDFDRLFGVASCASTTHAATTGFAGISTDAALPLSKAASVRSRVSMAWLRFRSNLILRKFQLCTVFFLHLSLLRRRC